MAALPGLSGRRGSGRSVVAALMAALLLLLAAVTTATALEGQEGRPAPADTAGPADTTATAADTAERTPASFPALLGEGDGEERGSAGSWSWGREDFLDSGALSLLDFLRDRLPGVLPLRVSYHMGPHHLMDGLFGPGQVRLILDGREIQPLEGGQVDLSRVSLVWLDRLRVERRAGETVIEGTMVSHPGGEAYSRVRGGTGEPDADLVRGVFTNGLGRDFTVAAAVDYANVNQEPQAGDRLDAMARLSWMPTASRRVGFELLWRSESLERQVIQTGDVDRREIQFHGRATLARGVQMDLWAGNTSRDPEVGTKRESAAADSAPPTLDLGEVQLGLRAERGPVFIESRVAARDEDGLADVEGSLRSRIRILPGLSVEGEGRFASFQAFEATNLTGGLVWRSGLPGGLVLRVEGSTGERGVARPVGEAERLDYDALVGSASLELGPYTVQGRTTYQKLDRQVPFGGVVDSLLETSGEVELSGLEGRLSGPLLPVGALEERVRVEGFWRHQETGDGQIAIWTPEDLALGSLILNESFFENNLEFLLTGRLEYRSEMRSAAPDGAVPVLLPSRISLHTEVVVRIDVFRFWWRVDNAQRDREQDFGDLVFPVNRNVFGITWEFFN